jgi:hypothetical protein
MKINYHSGLKPRTFRVKDSIYQRFRKLVKKKGIFMGVAASQAMQLWIDKYKNEKEF